MSENVVQLVHVRDVDEMPKGVGFDASLVMLIDPYL